MLHYWGCQSSHPWLVKGQWIISGVGVFSFKAKNGDNVLRMGEAEEIIWSDAYKVCNFCFSGSQLCLWVSAKCTKEWPKKTSFHCFHFFLSPKMMEQLVTLLKNAMIQSQESWGALMCKEHCLASQQTCCEWNISNTSGNFTVTYLWLLKKKVG